jgi:hypothetical protein
MVFIHRPKKRSKKPLFSSWRSSSRLVVLASAHGAEDLHDPRRYHQVQQSDEEQERGRHDRAEDGAELFEARVVVRDGLEDGLLGDPDPDPDPDPDGDGDGDRGVSQGESIRS